MRPSLILGSSSPRRQDLLRTVGLTFTVIKPETPEIPEPGEAPNAYVQRNAREKADWVAAHLLQLGPAKYPQGCIVISADTIVVLDDAILEKPRDAAHAAEMLRRLSGATHTVLSGVTLKACGAAGTRMDTFVASTEVRIKELSPREITSYIKTGEPLDKAGGYAAQGIGSYMVASIQGSYANVVGLPIADVVGRLQRDFSFDLWQ